MAIVEGSRSGRREEEDHFTFLFDIAVNQDSIVGMIDPWKSRFVHVSAFNKEN